MEKRMIAGLLAVLIMHGLYAQTDTPSPDVVKAANDGFTSYLTASITEDTKTIVGFDATDDLSKAVLGAPFKLYDLPSKAINTYNGKVKLRSLVQETDMWYFPIMINGTIKMMLYVGKREGVWERAGLGSAGLAKEMQAVVIQYSPKKGYTPLLVQQRATGDYLFSIPQVDAYNLTAVLANHTHANPKRYATLKKLSTTIPELRKRKEMQQHPVK